MYLILTCEDDLYSSNMTLSDVLSVQTPIMQIKQVLKLITFYDRELMSKQSYCPIYISTNPYKVCILLFAWPKLITSIVRVNNHP